MHIGLEHGIILVCNTKLLDILIVSLTEISIGPGCVFCDSFHQMAILQELSATFPLYLLASISSAFIFALLYIQLLIQCLYYSLTIGRSIGFATKCSNKYS